MQTELEQKCTSEENNAIFTKINNIEVLLNKQATERKGNGKAALVALCAAVIYFGSASVFSTAGKQQRPIAVEFNSMAINQSTLQYSYNQNLRQLLADLPNSNAVALNFKSNTADLANKIILLNANVSNSARLSLSVSAFLPIITDDFKAQFAAKTLSPENITKLQQTMEALKKTSEKLVTCKKNLEGESSTYLTGMTNNASPDAQANALIQITKTLASLAQGQSEAVTCMQAVDQFTATFLQLEQIHDNGIIEFNERAEQDTWRLTLSRSIAGMLLFFVGNPTRSYIQSLWSKFARKNDKP
jgi:hypothetical protein